MAELQYKDIEPHIGGNAVVICHDGKIWYGHVTGCTSSEDQSEDVDIGDAVDMSLIGGQRHGQSFCVSMRDIARIIAVCDGEGPLVGTYNLYLH